MTLYSRAPEPRLPWRLAHLGGLGDMTLPHLPFEELSFATVVSGPEEMRKAVRMYVKYGVDQLKINLSGEYIAGLPAELTWLRDQRGAGRASSASLSSRRARPGPEALAPAHPPPEPRRWKGKARAQRMGPSHSRAPQRWPRTSLASR